MAVVINELILRVRDEATQAMERIGQKAKAGELSVEQLERRLSGQAKAMEAVRRAGVQYEQEMLTISNLVERGARTEQQASDLKAAALAKMTAATEAAIARAEKFEQKMDAARAILSSTASDTDAAARSFTNWGGMLSTVDAAVARVASGIEQGFSRARQAQADAAVQAERVREAWQAVAASGTALSAVTQGAYDDFREMAAMATGLESALRGVSAAQKSIAEATGLSRANVNSIATAGTTYVTRGADGAVNRRTSAGGTLDLVAGDGDARARREADLVAAFAESDAVLERYREELGLVDTAQRKYESGLAEVEAAVRRSGADHAEAARILEAYAQAHDPALKKAADLAAKEAAAAEERAAAHAKLARDIEAESERVAAAYGRVIGAIDPSVKRQKEYETALADVVAYHTSVGSSAEAMAADMDRVKAALSPAAVEATRVAAENDRLAVSYRSVMAGIDPALRAQQEYDRALADLRAGAVAAGVSAEQLAADEQALAAAMSPAAVAAKKQADEMVALRRLIDPTAERIRELEQAERDLQVAFAAGRLEGGAAEYDRLSAALQRHRAIIERSTESQRSMRNALGLTRAQMSALSPQINDVVSGFMMGQDPMQIFLQQSGQIVQAMQAGGESIPVFTAGMWGLVGGIAAGVAAFAAWAYGAARFANDNREAERQMTLTGNAAGITADQFVEMTDAVSDTAGISNTAARDIASAYIGTGKIGGQVLADLTAFTKTWAVTTAQDTDQAAKDLAGMFSDPAKAAEQATQQWGVFSDAQLQVIRNLRAQGDLEGAQIKLLEGLKSRSVDAAEGLSWYAKAWNAVSTAVSDTVDAIGRIGQQTRADRISELQGLIANAQRNPAVGRRAAEFQQWEVADWQNELKSLQAEDFAKNLMAAADRWAAGFNRLQSQAMDFVRSMDPAITASADLANAQEMLRKAVDQGAISQGTATRALDIYKRQLQDTLDPLRAMSTEVERQVRIVGQQAGVMRDFESRRQAELKRLNLKPGDMLPQRVEDRLYDDTQREAIANAAAQHTANQQAIADAQALAAATASLSARAQASARARAEYNRVLRETNSVSAAQKAEQDSLALSMAQLNGQIGAQATQMSMQAMGAVALGDAWLAAVGGVSAYTDAQAEAMLAEMRAQAAVDALTQGIGEQVRLRQLVTDAASRQYATIAEDVAGLANEVAWQEKITAATTQGVKARKDMELAAETAAKTSEINALAMAAESVGATDLAARLRKLAEEYGRLAERRDENRFADALAQYGQQLKHNNDLLRERASLVGATDEERVMVEAQREVLDLLRAQGEEYDKLGAKRKAEVDAAIKLNQHNALLELSIARQENGLLALTGSLEKAFDRIGDGIVEAMVTGQAETIEWGNILRSIMASVLSDLAKMAAVDLKRSLGLATGTSGGLSDLTAAGAANGNIPWWNRPVFGGATTAAAAGNTAPVPGPIGVDPPPAAAPQGWTWGNAIGGGVQGLAVGAMNPFGGTQMGSMIGGALGGAGGSYVGTLLAGTAFSWLGPFAPVIGGILGSALGGLFGNDEPSNFGAGGTYRVRGGRVDNWDDASNSNVMKARDDLFRAVDDVVKMFRRLGGTGGPDGISLSVGERDDWEWRVGAQRGTVSVGDTDGLIAAVMKAYGQQLQGLAPDIAFALANSVETDLERLGADLDFAAGFKDQIRLLQNAGTEFFAAGRQAAKTFADSITDLVDTTTRVFAPKTSGLNLPSLPGYATGTAGAAPGWAWVGEEGPELVRFRGGETVVPTDRSKQLAAGMGRLPGYADGTDGHDGGYDLGSSGDHGVGGGWGLSTDDMSTEGGGWVSVDRDNPGTMGYGTRADPYGRAITGVELPGPRDPSYDAMLADLEYGGRTSVEKAFDALAEGLDVIAEAARDFLGLTQEEAAQVEAMASVLGVSGSVAAASMYGIAYAGGRAISALTGEPMSVGRADIGMASTYGYDGGDAIDRRDSAGGAVGLPWMSEVPRPADPVVAPVTAPVVTVDALMTALQTAGVSPDAYQRIRGLAETAGRGETINPVGLDTAAVLGDLERVRDVLSGMGVEIPAAFTSLERQVQALSAARAVFDRQVAGTVTELSDVGQAIEQARGFWGSEDIRRAAAAVGYEGQALVDVVGEGLANAMAKLRENYSADADATLNELKGEGWRNYAGQYAKEYQTAVQDIADLWGDGAGAAEELAKANETARLRFIELAKAGQISEEALRGLTARFPDLSDAIDAAADVIADAKTKLVADATLGARRALDPNYRVSATDILADAGVSADPGLTGLVGGAMGAMGGNPAANIAIIAKLASDVTTTYADLAEKQPDAFRAIVSGVTQFAAGLQQQAGAISQGQASIDALVRGDRPATAAETVGDLGIDVSLVGGVVGPMQALFDALDAGTIDATMLQGAFDGVAAALRGGQIQADDFGAIVSALTSRFGAAQQAAAALEQTQKDLQKQIWQLEGNTEALKAARDAELAQMPESTRHLQARIYALQDEAEVAQKLAAIQQANGALQVRLLNALGQSQRATLLDFDLRTAAERRQLEQTGGDLDLFDQVTHLERLQVTFEGARTAYLDALAREEAGIQAKLQSDRALYDAISGLARSMRDLSSSLKLDAGVSTLSPGDRLEEARGQLAEAIATARDSTKPLEERTEAGQRITALTQQLLQAALETFGGPASTAYAQEFTAVLGMIDNLGAALPTQLSISQSSLTALESQLAEIQHLRDQANSLGERQLSSLAVLQQEMMDSFTALTTAQNAATGTNASYLARIASATESLASSARSTLTPTKTFATGGYLPAGEIGIAGETGRPELIFGPAYVANPDLTSRMMDAAANDRLPPAVIPLPQPVRPPPAGPSAGDAAAAERLEKRIDALIAAIERAEAAAQDQRAHYLGRLLQELKALKKSSDELPQRVAGAIGR